MSFYGNLVNTNRTTFSFDKIYSNRTEMDMQCGIDSIMIGRFVLVRYDDSLSLDSYIKDFYIEKILEINENVIFLPDSNGLKSQSFLSKTELDSAPYDDLENFAVENGRYKRYEVQDTLYIEYSLDTGEQKFLDWDSFKIKVSYSGEEENYFPDYKNYCFFGRIINNELEINMDAIRDQLKALITDNPDEDPDIEVTKIYFVIPPEDNYILNNELCFFKIYKNETFNYKDKVCYKVEVLMDEENFYTINLSIDKQNYSTSKGYDSTVWQKVIEDGRERYIKVAELNTVVPKFILSTDAPQEIQIPPHLGQKSTNIDYDIHWANNWGFRIKAANQNLKVPTILSNGALDIVSGGSIDSQISKWKTRVSDTIQYPSDQKITWSHNFKNIDNDFPQDLILYYNTETQKWGTDTAAKVDAAIYFNKAGFDPLKIAYSEDLITEGSGRYKSDIADSDWRVLDSITITPTGQSGLQYNLHNGNIEESVAPDIQEMSIMLPSIGDALAKFWDTMYGGRDTSEDIKNTNKRNTIIEWENAKEEPARRGLRLTGIYGNDYNIKAMETVAGAINTTNDLLGMIISTHPESEIYENPGLKDLSFNRIYYNSDKKVYMRKHKTFDYTPLEEDEYYFNPQDSNNLNQDKINTGAYYELIDGEYVVATIYDPTKTYYLRSVTTRYELVEHPEELYDFPYENYLWYRDYLGENWSILKQLGLTDAELELKSDYIIDPEQKYQKDREYYEVFEHPVELNSEYEPNEYWYIDSYGNIMLDTNEERTINRIYYTLHDQDLLSLKQRNFAGVYVPNVYYFKRNDGVYEIDNSIRGTCNEQEVDDPNYYTVTVIRTYDDEGAEQVLRRVVTYSVLENAEEVYVPNSYFLKGPNDTYVISKDEEYDPSLTYYVQHIELEYIDASEQIEAKIDTDNPIPRGSLATFQNHTYYQRIEDKVTGELIEYKALTIRDFSTKGIEVLFNRIYPLEDIEVASNPPFYTLEQVIPHNTVLKKATDFYQEYLYHYKTENGSYILDTAKTMTRGRQYFTITVEKLPDDIHFFEPGEYYQKITDEEWEKIDGEKPQGDFYKQKKYYIYADEKNILEKGTEWNWEAAAIPPSITLATREDAYEMLPLVGYATKMNTINGMILQLNKMLEPGDRLTRDLDTVSGSLNVLRDTIARFSTMKSGEAVIIDMYGRIHSAPLFTSQSVTASNNKKNYSDVQGDLFETVSDVELMNNQWITASIDWDTKNPNITIHHNYQKVTDTVTNVFLSSGNSVNIPTPIIDKMGHVVGTKTYNITITAETSGDDPSGSLTIEALSTTEINNIIDSVINSNN